MVGVERVWHLVCSRIVDDSLKLLLDTQTPRVSETLAETASDDELGLPCLKSCKQ